MPIRITRRAVLAGGLRRVVALAALQPAIIALATACQATAPAPSGSTTAPAKPGATTAASTTAGGSGGTLIWAITAANLPGLDTVMCGTEGTEGHRTVGFQLYDCLTRYDLAKPGGSADILGGLAESWDLSPDAKTYTFHLRKNVQFHDDSPWNADVAVFNFDRLLNKAAPHFNARLGGQSATYTRGIASYRKVDDYTFEMVMAQPYSALPNQLVYIEMGSMAAIQKLGDEGFANTPVGSGPFKFAEVVPGQYLTMKRNPNYWRGAPKLDSVIIRPMSEAASRLAALRAGEANFIDVPPPESIDSLKQAGFVISMQDYPYMWPVHLNNTAPPWNNKLVRQAANYAINKEALANEILKGAAVAPYALTTPDDRWYSPEIKGYPYDLAKAKQLLAEAGYPDGFSSTLYYPSSGSGNMWPPQIMEYVQANLRDAGIKVEAVQMEWSALIQKFSGKPMKPEDGGWAGSIQTYQRYVWFSQFHSGPLNPTQYSTPEVESMLDQAFGSADPQRMDEIMKKVHVKLMDDIPVLLVTRDRLLRALSPKVKGFVQPQANFLDINSVYVEK